MKGKAFHRRLRRGLSCNSSRKGAGDASYLRYADAKEEKRVLVCYLRLLITRYARLQNPFSLCELCALCAFARDKPRHCAEGADASRLASFARKIAEER